MCVCIVLARRRRSRGAGHRRLLGWSNSVFSLSNCVFVLHDLRRSVKSSSDDTASKTCAAVAFLEGDMYSLESKDFQVRNGSRLRFTEIYIARGSRRIHSPSGISFRIQLSRRLRLIHSRNVYTGVSAKADEAPGCYRPIVHRQAGRQAASITRCKRNWTQLLQNSSAVGLIAATETCGAHR